MKRAAIGVVISNVFADVVEGPDEGQMIPGPYTMRVTVTKIEGITYDDARDLVGVEFNLVPVEAGRRF